MGGASGARREPFAASRYTPSVVDSARWNTFGLSTSGSSGRTTRTYYTTTAACTNLVADWVNAYGDETVANTFPYSVKAAVEVVPGPQTASGTLYPLTFGGGLAAATLQPGQRVTCDPLPLNLPAGQGTYVRTYASVTDTSYRFPLGRQHNPLYFEASVTGSDLVSSTSTWTGSASYSTGPVRIGGTTLTQAPTLVMVGSSTFQGIGDLTSANPGGGTYGWGWVPRLVAGTTGVVNMAMSGELGTAHVLATYRARSAEWAGCKHAIEGYGNNDINGSQSAAQIEAAKVRLWFTLAAQGCLVRTPTLQPNLTTSTDGFTSTANQNPAATNSVRVAVNAWIRAGAPIDPITLAPVAVGTSGALVAGNVGHPLVAWMEVADVVETARDSGKYKVGYTTDGQHLTATGCLAVVASMTNPFV